MDWKWKAALHHRRGLTFPDGLSFGIFRVHDRDNIRTGAPSCYHQTDCCRDRGLCDEPSVHEDASLKIRVRSSCRCEGTSSALELGSLSLSVSHLDEVQQSTEPAFSDLVSRLSST